MNDKRRSWEFRQEAVEYARSSGLSVRHVAENLGISYSTLYRWIRQAQIDAGEREGLTSKECEELIRLRRENRLLR